MSKQRDDGDDESVPERWCTDGASDFERRLLAAAGRERPSRELYERMALGIGISQVGASPPTEQVLNAAPKAATPWRSLLPWFSLTAVVVAVSGYLAIHGSHPRLDAPVVAQPVHSAAPIASSDVVAALASGTTEVAAAAPPRSTASAPRSRGGATVADIQDQIALLDDARAALAVGASSRALELLQQYRSKYPTGSFQPEAAALKIEALTKLGRMAEARALSRRFIEEHRGSPLSDRVSHIVGNAP